MLDAISEALDASRSTVKTVDGPLKRVEVTLIMPGDLMESEDVNSVAGGSLHIRVGFVPEHNACRFREAD